MSANNSSWRKNITPQGTGAIAKSFTMTSQSQIIYKKEGLSITMFAVEHDPVKPAVGYRSDYKGRSVVISGDTVQSKSLENIAKNADILVHEALQPKMVKAMREAFTDKKIPHMAAIMSDILDYHASPEEAAQSA